MSLNLGQRIAPPRFIAFALVAIAAGLWSIPTLGWRSGVPLAFDAGAVVFLLSCLPLLGASADAMRAAEELAAGALLPLASASALPLPLALASAGLASASSRERCLPSFSTTTCAPSNSSSSSLAPPSPRAEEVPSSSSNSVLPPPPERAPVTWRCSDCRNLGTGPASKERLRAAGPLGDRGAMVCVWCGGAEHGEKRAGSEIWRGKMC